MDDEEKENLIRSTLISSTLNLLEVAKLTSKHDQIHIDVLLSPQVFNPEYRSRKRRYTIIINVCIQPPESKD